MGSTTSFGEKFAFLANSISSKAFTSLYLITSVSEKVPLNGIKTGANIL